MPVLRTIDIARVGPEYSNAGFLQWEREIIGNLSAGGNDDALRFLKFINTR